LQSSGQLVGVSASVPPSPLQNVEDSGHEFPVDAPWFQLEGTKTARVVSMHGADTFTAVFRFYEDAFFKFKVKLARVHPPSDHTSYITRNRLFELITGTVKADTVMWRKRDFDR
jgi:hypothetical protein